LNACVDAGATSLPKTSCWKTETIAERDTCYNELWAKDRQAFAVDAKLRAEADCDAAILQQSNHFLFIPWVERFPNLKLLSPNLIELRGDAGEITDSYDLPRALRKKTKVKYVCQYDPINREVVQATIESTN
jgi:hypothetical protein